MNRRATTGLTWALLAFCCLSREAAAERTSSEVLTTVTVLPCYVAAQLTGQSQQKSSSGRPVETAPRDPDEDAQQGPSSAGSSAGSKDWSAATSEDSGNGSRQSSGAVSGSGAAPRKLIVPWRARTEAASWLGGHGGAAPSALLRSVLTELRQRHHAAGEASVSDQSLAAELIAEPSY